MYQNPSTALELNALYGEIISNITQIKDIETLKELNNLIKNFIAEATKE